VDTDRQLLMELAAASKTLVTVVDNAATTGIIESGYEDMLLGPAGVVKLILERCPGGQAAWDGTLDEREVREESIETAGDIRYQSEPTGVRLKHLPTGIVRESQSKGDYEDNKSVAWRALTEAVNRRYREMRV
jgi:hypothetical protein